MRTVVKLTTCCTALLLIAVACGDARQAGTTRPPIATTTLTVPYRSPSSDLPSSTSTTSGTTTTSVEAVPSYDWPDAGPPSWTTAPLGLPATADVRVTHGHLGFLSVNGLTQGAEIRTSVDGVTWQTTAMLEGPDGDEHLSIDDLLVTAGEYLVLGEAPAGEARARRDVVLWRSGDGVVWSREILDKSSAGALGLRLAGTSRGVMASGTVYPTVGRASPRLWLKHADGGFRDVSLAVGIESDSSIYGSSAIGDGLVVWGSAGGDEDTAAAWFTEDFITWSSSPIGGVYDIQEVAPLGGGWMAVGPAGVMVSDDASEWLKGARENDFILDASGSELIAGGWGRLLAAGEYVATVARVGHRDDITWCYEDPDDCLTTRYTVLVSPNGRDWRRITMPEEEAQSGLQTEHGFLVNGRLAVVHSVGEQTMLSILDSVESALPLNNGAKPDLPFEIVGPGDDIEPGVEYGYPLRVQCRLPVIGPLNGVHWSPIPGSFQPERWSPPERSGGDRSLAGFIELVAGDKIEYRLGGEVIARYAPDPEAEPTSCYATFILTGNEH